MRDIRRKFAISLLIAVMAVSVCAAQDGKQTQDLIDQAQELLKLRQELKDIKAAKVEPKFYRLSFLVKEIDGDKALNTRTYWMVVSTQSDASIRTGEKIQVPVTVASSQPGAVLQYREIDLGTDLDCRRVRPIGNELAMTVSVNVTGEPQNAAGQPAGPVIRHYIWSSEVVIPLSRPTVVFSSDHATGKSQMQVELTATPIP